MSRKLGDKGRDQVVQTLLVGVPKVKIKIYHRGLSGRAQGFNVLNNRGTGGRREHHLAEVVENPQTRVRSCLSQLRIQNVVMQSQMGNRKGRTFSMDPKKRTS